MALHRIKDKGTLTEKAYKEIKNAIINLDLKPCEVLLEEDLSKKLGISRTPIRSALQRLSYDGLVDIGDKKTVVKELSVEYFNNLFDIRESLEMLAVKAASINRTESDIKELKKLVSEQTRYAELTPIDKENYLKVDRKFHRLITKIAKNPILEKMLIQINLSYNRYLNFTDFKMRAMTVVREHEEICNAIMKRDSIKAQTTMEKHLRDVKESILVSLVESKRC
jgi:DNA-binding GntR family transcriptional regulator